MVMIEKLAQDCDDYLEKVAKKKGKKKKKKLDPKAKVRNKKSPVFPAESPKVKDKKDHFPLGDKDQAQNALSRSHQYSKAPPWYKGSLKELQEAVRRKVKSMFPSMEVSEPKKKKKSSLDCYDLLEKYATDDLGAYGIWPSEADEEYEEWAKNNPRPRDWSEKDWSKYLDSKYSLVDLEPEEELIVEKIED